MKKKNSFYAVITACMGLAVFLEGQTVAMWIAMQGMASARTPISMLTGEACINAAVAWLGGGSVVSGGGGIVVGRFILAVIPIIGAVMIVSALGYIVLQRIKNSDNGIHQRQ